MKGNIESLVQLAQTVQDITKRKEDFTRKTKELVMHDDNNLFIPKYAYNEVEEYRISDHAHQQLANRLDIPKKYYDRMTEIPGLRKENVNAWLNKSNGFNTVRTLDGTVRAFLSDRYKPVDNYIVLAGFLPVMKEMNVQVKSCSLTERKMYIQVVFPKLQEEVVPGDPVQLGVVISNSEVGCGAVAIKTILWRLVCSNGMVGENVIRRYHAGRRIGNVIEDYDIFSDETILAELEVFKKKLRDMLAACITTAYLGTIVEQFRKAAESKIMDVPSTLKNVTKEYGFTNDEETKILMNTGAEKSRLSNHSVTRWNLANSITALAHEIEDPERQYFVEKTGYEIATMPEKKWQNIETVAIQ